MPPKLLLNLPKTPERRVDLYKLVDQDKIWLQKAKVYPSEEVAKASLGATMSLDDKVWPSLPNAPAYFTGDDVDREYQRAHNGCYEQEWMYHYNIAYDLARDRDYTCDEAEAYANELADKAVEELNSFEFR